LPIAETATANDHRSPIPPYAREVSVRIREFEPGDEVAFRRLNEEWIRRYFSLEDKDRELFGDPRGKILESGGFIFLAVDGDEAVGCSALLSMDDGGFELGKMAVTPSRQGQGIARLLLHACVEKARSRRAPRIYLETNSRLEAAVRLYERAGFRHLPPEEAPPSRYARVDRHMEMRLDRGSGAEA